LRTRRALFPPYGPVTLPPVTCRPLLHSTHPRRSGPIRYFLQPPRRFFDIIVVPALLVDIRAALSLQGPSTAVELFHTGTAGTTTLDCKDLHLQPLQPARPVKLANLERALSLHRPWHHRRNTDLAHIFQPLPSQTTSSATLGLVHTHHQASPSPQARRCFLEHFPKKHLRARPLPLAWGSTLQIFSPTSRLFK
jgi:hypothetical protein